MYLDSNVTDGKRSDKAFFFRKKEVNKGLGGLDVSRRVM